jgi:hypothetical protein
MVLVILMNTACGRNDGNYEYEIEYVIPDETFVRMIKGEIVPNRIEVGVGGENGYECFYSENPEMKINGEDYLTLYNCVKRMNGNITWDKIFVLPPKNSFVDDGSRYMGQSSMDERQKNFDKLMGLLEDFGLIDKVEVLFSDFSNNFEHVKQYIQSLYV